MNAIDRFLSEELILTESIAVKDYRNSKIGIVFFPPDGDNDPHMHLHSNTLSKYGDIGIKLRDAYYHKHKSCMGEFKNSKCIKIFIDFLDRKDDDGITNWQHVLDRWNATHSSAPKHCKIDLNFKRPDYMKIQDIPKGNNAHTKRGK